MWSCASLACYSEPFLQSMSRAATQLLQAGGGFDTRDLTMIAWALAKVAFLDVPLITVLATSTGENLSLFSPQGLANMVWAFATFQ